MIPASQLRPGMAIRYEGQLFKVISAEYHPGQGQMGGVTHAHLKNLATGSYWDHGFRADEKLEDLPVDKVPMEFLYRDGDQCVFMNPETFEQIEIPAEVLGRHANLLKEQMQVNVEFVEEKPVSVEFPPYLEVRVEQTAPPAHTQQDNTWKEATLENGLVVMVPQFIKTGDIIRLDTEKLEYMDRVRG